MKSCLMSSGARDRQVRGRHASAFLARGPWALLVVLISGVLAASRAPAQVTINEFVYDDAGADDQEFVELFNGGAEPVDVGGWALLVGEAGDPSARHAIPDGTTIEAGGFLVVGSATLARVDVPLASQDLFLDGAAYIALFDLDLEIVDHVLYETNKGIAGFPPELVEGGGIWGNQRTESASLMSWQRWRDGLDSGDLAFDFGQLPWSPGASNEIASPASFSSDFEDLDPEADVPALPGSFVPGRVIDPTQVSASNPGVIPESPDGGQALVAWDPAGGGNFTTLPARASADMYFEAWVYLDARPELPTELETWSIGLRGTSGSFYNTPILFDQNGNTGVAWTFQVSDAGATLFLVEEGLGGPAANRPILGQVEIIPGENDGWQRLRLEVEGDRVRGVFGGSIGDPEGDEVIEAGLVTATIGTFYIGYREALSNDSTARPPTLDELEVGSLDVDPPAGPGFVRGDTNADRTVNLSDAVALLGHLFLGAAAPPCRKAADADDDGRLALTDAVRILNSLFLGGPEPSAPFPDCGFDPTEDALDCVRFAPCEPQ